MRLLGKAGHSKMHSLRASQGSWATLLSLLHATELQDCPALKWSSPCQGAQVCCPACHITHAHQVLKVE